MSLSNTQCLFLCFVDSFFVHLNHEKKNYDVNNYFNFVIKEEMKEIRINEYNHHNQTHFNKTIKKIETLELN